MKLSKKIFFLTSLFISHINLAASNKESYWNKRRKQLRRSKVENFSRLIREGLDPQNIDIFVQLHVASPKGDVFISQKIKTKVLRKKITKRIQRHTLEALKNFAETTENKIDFSSLTRLLREYEQYTHALTKEELILRRFAKRNNNSMRVENFISILEEESSKSSLKRAVKKALAQFYSNKMQKRKDPLTI